MGWNIILRDCTAGKVSGSLTAIGYCDNFHGPVILPYLHQGKAHILQHNDLGLSEAEKRSATGLAIQKPGFILNRAPLWDHLDSKVRQRYHINNLWDLERALHREWLNIPLQVIRRLINNMKRCCQAVINKAGGSSTTDSCFEFRFRPLYDMSDDSNDFIKFVVKCMKLKGHFNDFRYVLLV